MQDYCNHHVREVCHGVKERDNLAIKEMADYFLNLELVTSKTIIIPAPQHEGHAIYTRQMAEIIADNVGCRVADVLISRPRKPLYELKKDGTLYKEPLEFMLTERVEGDEIFFLDNVLATGTTFQAANRLFKRKLKPLIYAEARI